MKKFKSVILLVLVAGAAGLLYFQRIEILVLAEPLIDEIVGVKIISLDQDTQEIKLKGYLRPGGQDTCSVDGVCSMIVGNMEVVWAKGWPRKPAGTIEPRIKIGDIVEVYGKRTGNRTVTIFGSKSYYIKSANGF